LIHFYKRNSRPEARQAIIKVNKTRAVKNSSDTSSKSEGYKNQRRRDHWHYQELLATPIRKHFLTVWQLISDGANFFKTFEEIFQDCLYPGTTWLKRAKNKGCCADADGTYSALSPKLASWLGSPSQI
jgi:hypothetical protein